MIVCVIVCCPQVKGAIFCICILICIYISVIVFLFCIFSCFYWGRAKFNNCNHFLAVYMLVCVSKFEIITYIWKYKCICICILSYYTYSGTEYLDGLLYNITWVLQCLFSYFYHLCLLWGVFCTLLRGEYSPCPSNRGIPL